jgi:hypothetical protein
MSLRVRWGSRDACAWELGKAWAASIKVDVGCNFGKIQGTADLPREGTRGRDAGLHPIGLNSPRKTIDLKGRYVPL